MAGDHADAGALDVDVVEWVVVVVVGAPELAAGELQPAAKMAAVASAATVSAVRQRGATSAHYFWAGRPLASRARWRDHVSSTMSVFVPVTRPRRRSCSMT